MAQISFNGIDIPIVPNSYPSCIRLINDPFAILLALNGSYGIIIASLYYAMKPCISTLTFDDIIQLEKEIRAGYKPRWISPLD